MSTNPTTAADAVALLERSSLPTVITEGITDYSVMRRIEARLADIDVDFLPLSGKSTVLSVWKNLSQETKKRTLSLVDLDDWIYVGIPADCIGDGLEYTVGYSIENDLVLDGTPETFFRQNEKDAFQEELKVLCSAHAAQILACRNGNNWELKDHANKIIAAGDKTQALCEHGLQIKSQLVDNYKQLVRGKSLFELIARQLSSKGRTPKFGYAHLYEIAATSPGTIMQQFEQRVRKRLG